MHRLRLIALLGLPLILAACGATASATSPTTPPVSQEQLMEAAGTLNDIGPQRWPDSYAGAETDIATGALLVRRVPVDGVDAEIRAAAPGITIQMADATHPATDLTLWIAWVRADTTWWKRRGVTIHSSYVRYGECAVVEIDHPQRDAARFATRYPDAAICVEQGHPSEPLAD